MGQEINSTRFEPADFEAFHTRLQEETDLLSHRFRDGDFSSGVAKGGFELEAWLVDANSRPAAINEPYLKRLNDDLVVPELASFNVELNSSPQELHGGALRHMHHELNQVWAHCNATAGEMDARLAMIGILPTVRADELTAANMSGMKRYRALNEQVLRMRRGEPLSLAINGRTDFLETQHANVMLESATTSFQIHLKVPVVDAVRVYNISKIISAPMVAVSANSPYLFGHDLWDETRIPLFEQAVAVGASDYTKRVTFGIRYAEESLMECFTANLDRYPVLLPMVEDSAPGALQHVRLHNGTIWRWTRPLIGFDQDGHPHLRIEHRVVPAGPSVVDCVANAAFYFGLCHGLVRKDGTRLESDVPFPVARANFYESARMGLDTEIEWPQGRRIAVSLLVLEELLPAARRGLEALQIDQDDIAYFLGIIEHRVRGKQNGAAWQRAFVRAHGSDWEHLVSGYLKHQQSGAPVHEWDV